MAGVGYAGTAMHTPDGSLVLDDYFQHIAFLVDFYRKFAAA